MPYHKAIFHIPGGAELKAHNGYVPDAFFDAAQNVTATNLITTYEGGFSLTNDMHKKLDVPGAYSSYASVTANVPEGSSESEVTQALINKLKEANHARPVEDNLNYQVFIMEYIEEAPDDD